MCTKLGLLNSLEVRLILPYLYSHRCANPGFYPLMNLASPPLELSGSPTHDQVTA